MAPGIELGGTRSSPGRALLTSSSRLVRSSSHHTHQHSPRLVPLLPVLSSLAVGARSRTNRNFDEHTGTHHRTRFHDAGCHHNSSGRGGPRCSCGVSFGARAMATTPKPSYLSYAIGVKDGGDPTFDVAVPVDDEDEDEDDEEDDPLLLLPPSPPPRPPPTPLTSSQLIAFGLPALGALLADPFCSLVDTAVVGRVGHAAGLAALGPNTAIFGGVCQVFSFLTTATTASVARLAGQKTATGRYVSAALVIAASLGALVCVGLQLGHASVLEAMSTSPEIMPLAGEYLRVRAFSLPALLVVTVCTAVCLGQRDPKSPLVAAAAATAVNVALDLYLVAGPPAAGVTGAAAATVAAQYCSAAVLMYKVHKSPDVPLRLTTPTPEDFAPLTRAWPVALRSVLLMASIASITASASSLGTVPTAAHQVLLTTLTIAQFLPEPVSQCAQSFLAKGAPGTESRAYVNQSSATLLGAAAAVSLLTAAFALVPVLAPAVFTADAAVAAAVYASGLAFTATCALLPLVCVTDGLLLAQREYTFCTLVLCVTATVVLVYLGGSGGVLGLGMVGRLLAPPGWAGPATIPRVWTGFVLMQASRLAQNAARLWWTNHRDARRVAERGGQERREWQSPGSGSSSSSAAGAGGGAGGAGYHRL